jgi:hypothetical protein
MPFNRPALLLTLACICTLPLAATAASQPAAALSPVVGVPSAAPLVSAVERRALTPNVAEYFFKVRVGAGPYDVIGVHRVVKETSPYHPIRARKALFLAHGDIWNFRAAFLTALGSPALPDDQALPVYLAENGIDVWGIDFRWTFVPATETDLAFLADWGIETDARDLGIALGAARLTRALTGSGGGKIALLGWSRGGQIGYAYLNAETRLPAALRQVKGFIPVDIYLKTDVEDFRQRACQRLAATEASLAAGVYASTSGGLISALGSLAIADPGGPSFLNGPPFNLPGYTNREAGLLVGEATFVFLAGLEPVPFYHFTGGTFDAQGKPTGLLYAVERGLFDFEAAASPVQPNRELADADAATCDETDVRFDDHLDDITVPVLYVGAGGGFGAAGLYTTTLLGSTDVTSHIVSLTPPANRIADFGHADLFLSDEAETLVWPRILSWVRTH